MLDSRTSSAGALLLLARTGTKRCTHSEIHMHPKSSKEEPERDKTIYVGTIVRGPSGDVLVTSSRDLALVSGKESLMAWQERRVVISGVCCGPDAIEVTSIDEMMSEREILECVGFLASRYRQHAHQHARDRLEAAIKSGSPQEIAVWRAITSLLESQRGAARSSPVSFHPPC
jgi:hypothetical protein